MSSAAGEPLEQLARHVGDRTVAGRAVAQFAGIGLGVGDQFLKRMHRQSRVDDDGGRAEREHRHAGKALHRIVGRLRHRGRRQHLRGGAAEQDAVAVGLRMRHVVGADDAAAAAAVVDDDGAEDGLHPLGPKPADDIVHTRRHRRDDEADGPAWIRLLREGGPRRRHGGRHPEQKSVTSSHHGVRSNPISRSMAMLFYCLDRNEPLRSRTGRPAR